MHSLMEMDLSRVEIWWMLRLSLSWRNVPLPLMVRSRRSRQAGNVVRIRVQLSTALMWVLFPVWIKSRRITISLRGMELIRVSWRMSVSMWTGSWEPSIWKKAHLLLMRTKQVERFRLLGRWKGKRIALWGERIRSRWRCQRAMYWLARVE